MKITADQFEPMDPEEEKAILKHILSKKTQIIDDIRERGFSIVNDLPTKKTKKRRAGEGGK